MLQVSNGADVRPDHVDLHFDRSNRWDFPARGVDGAYVRLGDDERGPVLFLFALATGAEAHVAPAHGHASDNWRISLRGTQPMGPDRYGPGAFRFQEGWKPYGSDAFASGPEGGWTALVFGDGRGIRSRYVKPTERDSSRLLASWTGLAGDLVSDDPSTGAGPSALISTLGPVKASHLNGDFSDSSTWTSGTATGAAVSLFGDPEVGPVLVCACTEPGELASGAQELTTEVVHIVVDGTCTIDGEHYRSGDVRVQPAGHRCGEVVAGPDGLREVVVLGDRRSAIPPKPSAGWPQVVASTFDDLLGELRRRPSTTSN